jgi:hypothetical protein
VPCGEVRVEPHGLLAVHGGSLLWRRQSDEQDVSAMSGRVHVPGVQGGDDEEPVRRRHVLGDRYRDGVLDVPQRLHDRQHRERGDRVHRLRPGQVRPRRAVGDGMQDLPRRVVASPAFLVATFESAEL